MNKNYLSSLLFSAVLLFLISSSMFAESVVEEWIKTYNSPNNANDYGSSIAVDSSDNVYVTGCEWRYDLLQGFNIWTRKYDPDGYEIWTSTYNSPANRHEYSCGIAADSSGNVYVTGYESADDLGQDDNILTQKYDPNGYVVWTSTYNSPVNSAERSFDIAVDDSGNVYITGYEYRGDLGQCTNIWTRKYDPNGYEIWTSTYNSPSTGNSSDCGYGIAVDGSGNVYVTGFIERGDLGQCTNIWTRKYDTDGYEVWTATYNSPSNREDVGRGIALDSSGNVYVTGYENRPDLGQSENIWTRKYNPNGYEVWTATYNSPNNGVDRSYDITLDSVGNIEITGFENRDDLGQSENIWMRKYDTDGYEIWTSTYNSTANSEDRGYGIAVDSSNNVYVAGYEYRTDLGQSYNIWIGKYRINGSIGGTITDGTNPIEGVTVSVSGDSTANTLTDASGNYSFSNLDVGSTYTLAPSHIHFTFTPTDLTYSDLSSDTTTANFTGVLKEWDISGTITDGTDSVEGVLVSLSGNSSANTLTDASGNYSFSNLDAGATYIIMPTKTDYVFTPVDRTYTDLSGDVSNADFTGPLNQWSISGTIIDGANPLPDVTVNLSGDSTAITTTDVSGNYAFNNLDAGSTYVVTSTKTHWTFTPVERTCVDLSSDVTDADFTGTLNQWTISGTITDGANPLLDVTVNLTGDSTASTITDGSGNYAFNNLNAGATYVITPTKKNYSFTPENSIYVNLDSSEIQDFIGTKLFATDLSEVKVYPNPYKDEYGTDTITFTNLTENAEIRIYTVSGKLVAALEPELLTYEWDLNNDAGNRVASGIYFCLITNEKGEKAIKKLAVIR